MKRRCEDRSNPAYPRYGGRGIFVCDEWVADFGMFRAWALQNGYAPHLTIDRFPDNDGPYAPSNCRWATPTEQNRNRRDNNPVVYLGETLLISQLAERCGLPQGALWLRIRRYGWPVEKAVTQPLRARHGEVRASEHLFG
jgi:hypothetical protein